MTPDELRAIVSYLEGCVRLEGERGVAFDQPDVEQMLAAGLDGDGSHRVRAAEWWPEMVEEILETPDFCEPDDNPEQVLRYARDVVVEYVGKRFPLNPE